MKTDHDAIRFEKETFYTDQYRPNPDLEMRAFEEGLLLSLHQAKRGEYAAVHTPEQIMARRLGRPPLAAPKQAVKVRLDADLLASLRATGRGWQTRVNAFLNEGMKAGKFATP
jgi:uncharacterized protein (DUF4415 family)